MSANEKQVGGDHYKSNIQHWDYVVANELDYFQAQITKYVTRWRKKDGLPDLEKAKHFLEKYIEVEKVKHDKILQKTCAEVMASPYTIGSVSAPKTSSSLLDQMRNRVMPLKVERLENRLPELKSPQPPLYSGQPNPFGFDPSQDS